MMRADNEEGIQRKDIMEKFENDACGQLGGCIELAYRVEFKVTSQLCMVTCQKLYR